MDSTLLNTPLPDEGKKTWKNKTNTDYPHVGWWGRKESLNDEIFDIQTFPSIYNAAIEDIEDQNTFTVLLTSRLQKLMPEIKMLLNKHNLLFDELSLQRGKEDKSDRIKSFLKKFPDVERIDIYDDREKELKIFRDLKKEIGEKYQINIYKVNNGK